MRTLLIIVAAVLFLPLSVAYYFIALYDPGERRDPWKECDRGIDQIAIDSPDRAWTARGIYLGCGGPMTIRAWDNVVIVKKGQEPTIGDEVLTGDWDVNLVKLEWKNENLLRITLPIEAEIYRLEAGLHDIAVEVKFDPDDPEAREQVLQKREIFLRERAERLAKIKSR
jgi:hypothetical protein